MTKKRIPKGRQARVRGGVNSEQLPVKKGTLQDIRVEITILPNDKERSSVKVLWQEKEYQKGVKELCVGVHLD